ncbi:hypothetical protein PRIPAC_93175, partial [Pristionchus pacificus]
MHKLHKSNDPWKWEKIPVNDYSYETLNKVNVAGISLVDYIAVKDLNISQILSSFPVSGVEYTQSEWDDVARTLQKLNVRCLSAGCGPVCSLACTTPLVTVKTLFCSEIDFENATEGAAEQLLNEIPTLFPRMESLVFDWNMVDPALTIDESAKKIMNAICALRSKLSLSMVAIIAYTPCGEMKIAA